MVQGFNPTVAQTEAINEVDNNLQIIACAGSGKTEVISRRIAKILTEKTDVKAENIVAFTFTKKAAESLKERISKACDNQIDLNAMYIGTIHSFCFDLLKKHTEKFNNFRVLDTVKCHHFISRYYKECGISDLELELRSYNINLFLQCIDKMIDDYANKHLWTEQQVSVFEKYKNCLYEKSFIDFSLIILETLEQIKISSDIQERLGKIKYLVVDEYQDIDNLQEKLIKSISDAGANICVVGDDDQTIYRFRGSNAENMITFNERYTNCHQVKLITNFRCTPGIVDIANTVICNNTQRISKKMISGIQNNDSLVFTMSSDSDKEQYAQIAKTIQSLVPNGTSYRDIAVLVRKGKHTILADRILTSYGIPTETDSAEEFFEGQYFPMFVKTLSILSNIDKAALYECWNGFVDNDKFNIAFKFLRCCANGKRDTLRNIFVGFCDRIDFLNANDYELRKVALDGFLKILDDFDEIYGDWQLSARANKIIKFLENSAAEEYKYYRFREKNSENNAVQIMTIHKSKGLEYDTVFLPELMDKEFPVSNIGGKKYWYVLGGRFNDNKEKYQSDIEDERKLFYVAATRAKKRLYLCYHLDQKNISPFLREANESNYIDIPMSDLGEKF